MLCLSIFLFSACSSKSGDIKSVDKSIRDIDSNYKAEEAFKELDNEKSDSSIAFDELLTESTCIKDCEEIEVVKDKSNPVAVTEKARPSSKTNSPIIDEVPEWVINPNAYGYDFVAVGFANGNVEEVSSQKRIARIQGMGELSRIIKIQIDNEILKMDLSVNGEAISDIKTYSRQRSDSLLSSVEEIDNWIDPKTGDYYLLLGIKGE